MNLLTLAVRIAGDIHEGALRSGGVVEPMDRHDREQLAERPMIEQRLEHGKIADVLIAERRLQLLHFVRHITQAAMHVHDLVGDLPVNGVDLRFRFEIEQTEIECLLRVLFDLLESCRLSEIVRVSTAVSCRGYPSPVCGPFRSLRPELWCGLFDRAKRFDNQHRMMRDNGAPAFADNRRMRDSFGVANVDDVPDDVVRVFLERVIGRTVKVAARSIVIDAEPAADVEITKFVSKFGELCVKARGFAHGAFDRRNVRHLRADVEMDKLEAMCEPGSFSI